MHAQILYKTKRCPFEGLPFYLTLSMRKGKAGRE